MKSSEKQLSRAHSGVYFPTQHMPKDKGISVVMRTLMSRMML
jgi:hypothetical protein